MQLSLASVRLIGSHAGCAHAHTLTQVTSSGSERSRSGSFLVHSARQRTIIAAQTTTVSVRACAMCACVITEIHAHSTHTGCRVRAGRSRRRATDAAPDAAQSVRARACVRGDDVRSHLRAAPLQHISFRLSPHSRPPAHAACAVSGRCRCGRVAEVGVCACVLCIVCACTVVLYCVRVHEYAHAHTNTHVQTTRRAHRLTPTPK
jgi:hypothetical protein